MVSTCVCSRLCTRLCAGKKIPAWNIFWIKNKSLYFLNTCIIKLYKPPLRVHCPHQHIHISTLSSTVQILIIVHRLWVVENSLNHLAVHSRLLFLISDRRTNSFLEISKATGIPLHGNGFFKFHATLFARTRRSQFDKVLLGPSFNSFSPHPS